MFAFWELTWYGTIFVNRMPGEPPADVPTNAPGPHNGMVMPLIDTYGGGNGGQWSYDPPGCYVERGILKWNPIGAKANTGECGKYGDVCVCHKEAPCTTGYEYARRQNNIWGSVG